MKFKFKRLSCLILSASFFLVIPESQGVMKKDVLVFPFSCFFLIFFSFFGVLGTLSEIKLSDLDPTTIFISKSEVLKFGI